jgi:cytochrome c oxidase accessory protein FixG
MDNPLKTSNQARHSQTPLPDNVLPEEVIYTDLYQKRNKIYPGTVKGIFANMRLVASILLLGLYYVFPWIQWNGHQAVLFDIPHQRFYYFGVTFWPQDFFYLTLILITAAIALFLFTSVAGRLWCGYACPQTVWAKSFMWIEKVIEGERNKRIKLDSDPISANKIIRKALKHFVWILFAGFTGFTFVGYFTPIKELLYEVLTFSTTPWETFWLFLYGAMTYLNAGKLREQFCIYICPYARFQSAMFDKDTLIIAYDADRGESRGHRKKSTDTKEADLGDCIDCKLCVNVCPTGIDIRDGLQMECIACAACIDACDQVMEKMDYSKGLIRYTTEHKDEGRPSRILRPRVVIYCMIFFGLVGLLAWSLYNRIPLELDIIRDRNRLYVQNVDGDIENVYKLRILNLDQAQHDYKITIQGIVGIRILQSPFVRIDAGEVATVPVRAVVKSEQLKQAKNTITFSIVSTDGSDISVIENARFIGPDYSRLLRSKAQNKSN